VAIVQIGQLSAIFRAQLANLFTGGKLRDRYTTDIGQGTWVKVVALEHLGETLTAARAHYQAAGYRRGSKNSTRNSLLVIDDDEDAAFFACHSLKDEYEVDMAYDGLSGYKLWENKRHDLILLDLMFPVMMGDIVLEKIMEIDQNQPVIIITGQDKPDNHKEFFT